MAKRALLVGCNYPGTQCELHGCANDVRRMRRTLVERFGFDESDILMMLDTDPSTLQPTGANIRSSLRKLINSVEPGDVLVFHYSGHGTQVPPESGAPGEMDTEEAIVPTDMNLLTDDDFRDLVNQIPPGVTFTFLSDSCHSGGMIDNEKEQIGGGRTGGGSSAQQAFLGGGGGGGGGGVGGGLMGLISQGLQAYAGQRGAQSQTRDFPFPSSGGRIQKEEPASYREDQGYREPQRFYEQQEGYGEDGYEGEGRRLRGSDEYGGYGGRRPQEEFYADRRGYGEEGYGARGQYEQEGGYREEGYEGDGKRRQEEFYEGRRGHGEGHEGRGQRLYQQEGYGEEGYGEGRRHHQHNDEYEGQGRGGYVNEGYGGRRQQDEFYESRRQYGDEGYGGRGRTEEDYKGEGQRVYGEQVYGGRPTRGQGQEYYETEGGVGYNAGEGYGGEAYGNVYSGRRYERTAEEGYSGYGGTQPAPSYYQSQGETAYGSPRVVSKSIPVDLLTQILSQRTGQNVQVGNIRTTIFDMFGEQASPSVKMFVNLALSQLQRQEIRLPAVDFRDGQQGKGQGGWLGTISSLASQFLQTKLDDQGPEDASNYMAPAQHAQFPRPKTRVASDASILVSGCQMDETSADANPTQNPNSSYGAFSNAVQTVLGQNSSPMTNRDLVLAVRHVLGQQGFKQHPCLYCSDDNVDAPFIC